MDEFFDGFQEEKCACEHCSVARDYTEFVMQAKNEDEVFNIIRGMFDEAHDTGYQQALYDDIQLKIQMMNQNDSEM